MNKNKCDNQDITRSKPKHEFDKSLIKLLYLLKLITILSGKSRLNLRKFLGSRVYTIDV